LSGVLVKLNLDEDKFLTSFSLGSPNSLHFLSIIDLNLDGSLTLHTELFQKAVTSSVESTRLSDITVEVSSSSNINNFIAESTVLTEFEFFKFALSFIFGEREILGSTSVVDFVIFCED
jgi:hypothetical protein